MTVENPGPYNYNDWVKYKCPNGYEVFPPEASANCQSNGRWFAQHAECRRKSFPCTCELNFIKNRQKLTRHFYLYLCVFNPVSFAFVAVDCRFPGEPRFGSTIANNGYQLGAEISFECNNGYRMEGSSWAVCTDTGRWEPSELPTCHGKYSVVFVIIVSLLLMKDIVSKHIRSLFPCSSKSFNVIGWFKRSLNQSIGSFSTNQHFALFRTDQRSDTFGNVSNHWGMVTYTFFLEQFFLVIN